MNTVESQGSAITIESSVQVAQTKKGFFERLPEDWWAVLIGGMIIAAILLFALASPGYKFITPVYQWAGTNELSAKVFSATNLLVLGAIGAAYLAICTISLSLSGN
ncbi:MAG TPA: hypothetical protein VGB56_08610, partial [Flavisolibacter sp.]